MTEPRKFLAHPLRVDERDERVWLNQQPVRLGPKPFRVLLSLMDAAPNMLTKDELVERVWEGKFVSDAVLTTAMRDLRRALGDDARTPEFIETVHGRGYRFLKPVTASRPSEADPGEQTGAGPGIAELNRLHLFGAAALLIVIGVIGWFLFGGVGGRSHPSLDATGAADASIAILPFADLSPNADQRYFSEGLSEEIINVLTPVAGLKVASRTSAFAFRERESVSVPEIASSLGVQYVLEGSVRKAADQVRITAQLIDGSSDQHIWSRTYERELSVDTLFEVQDEIAQLVVAMINDHLTTQLGVGSVPRAGAAGTDNLKAYELYLDARQKFVERRDLDTALEQAREAVANDPEFARGWEMLAAAAFVREGQPTAEAIEAVETALDLDDRLSLAHAIKGVLVNNKPPYDWIEAVDNLERAVELDPSNTSALLWLGVEMRKLGFLESAQLLFERCIMRDPAYHRCQYHRMWTAHMAGDTDLALADYAELHVKLPGTSEPPDDAVMMLAVIDRGDEASLQLMIDSLDAQIPPPETVMRAMRDEAVDLELAQSDLRNWLNQTYFNDGYLNHRDVYPIILKLRAYELIPMTQGSFLGLWLPEFPEYRRSDHFKETIRTLRIDKYWRARGFPPQCHAVGADDFMCDG